VRNDSAEAVVNEHLRNRAVSKENSMVFYPLLAEAPGAAINLATMVDLHRAGVR